MEVKGGHSGKGNGNCCASKETGYGVRWGTMVQPCFYLTRLYPSLLQLALREYISVSVGQDRVSSAVSRGMGFGQQEEDEDKEEGGGVRVLRHVQ